MSPLRTGMVASPNRYSPSPDTTKNNSSMTGCRWKGNAFLPGGTTCTAQPRPLSPTSGPTRPHLTANCLPLPRSMSGTSSILMTVFSDISQTPFQTNRNALLRLASKFHRQLLYGYTQVGRLTRFDAFATAPVDTRCVRAGASGSSWDLIGSHGTDERSATRHWINSSAPSVA